MKHVEEAKFQTKINLTMTFRNHSPGPSTSFITSSVIDLACIYTVYKSCEEKRANSAIIAEAPTLLSTPREKMWKKDREKGPYERKTEVLAADDAAQWMLDVGMFL